MEGLGATFGKRVIDIEGVRSRDAGDGKKEKTDGAGAKHGYAVTGADFAEIDGVNSDPEGFEEGA